VVILELWEAMKGMCVGPDAINSYMARFADAPNVKLNVAVRTISL
jgi:hypothetical protein